VERIAENGFYGTILFIGLIIFPTSSGFAQEDPISGTITDTLKFFGIHEGL
jgi:hypothetical protein